MLEEEAAEMKGISMAAIENFSASARWRAAKRQMRQTKPARQWRHKSIGGGIAGVAWRRERNKRNQCVKIERK
jgi:hypothetical protein